MGCCGMGFGIDCSGNSLAMNTVNANPSVDQSQCCTCGCGGAGRLSSALNAIGKWGTAITGIVQGKPVASGRSGVVVGAKGSNTLPGRQQSGMSLLIFVIIIAVIFMLLKR